MTGRATGVDGSRGDGVAVSAISSSIADPRALASAQPSSGFSELTSEEFTRIMFEELSSQDPLEPSDTGALLEQLSTLRSIESDAGLVDQLGSLVRQNELGAASGLIGRFVSGVGEEDVGRTSGVVFSVSQTREGAVLNLDNGARVPMGNVDEVFDLDEFGIDRGEEDAGDAGDAGDADDADDAGDEGDES